MFWDATPRSKFRQASHVQKIHKIDVSREPHMLEKNFLYQNFQKLYISISNCKKHIAYLQQENKLFAKNHFFVFGLPCIAYYGSNWILLD